MPVQRREAVGAGLQSGVASGEHSHTHTHFFVFIFLIKTIEIDIQKPH